MRVPPALEQSRLVHELPGAGPAPAALEECLEAGGGRIAGEAPALIAHDRGQEPARVPARGLRHQPVDPAEEARLVLRAELRIGPVAGHGEVPHADQAGEPVEGRVADAVVDGVGRVVRRDRDHRAERRPLAGVRGPVPDAAQVRHEQHRLHQARAHVHPVRREAVHACPTSRRAPTSWCLRACAASAGPRARGVPAGSAPAARCGSSCSGGPGGPGRPPRSGRRRGSARGARSDRWAGRASRSCRRRAAGS